MTQGLLIFLPCQQWGLPLPERAAGIPDRQSRKAGPPQSWPRAWAWAASGRGVGDGGEASSDPARLPHAAQEEVSPTMERIGPRVAQPQG